MALANNALPYGIRDIKVTPITSDDGTPVYGTMVDLPAARTLSWNTSEDYEQLRGDDQVQAEHGNGLVIEWDLEQGGISLDAYAVIAGGVVTTSGVTPSVVKKYSATGTTATPYFRIDGQSINDNGGDTKIIIFRAKATGGIEGSFEEGSFNVTSCSGTGYPDGTGALYDIIQSETAAAITQPA